MFECPDDVSQTPLKEARRFGVQATVLSLHYQQVKYVCISIDSQKLRAGE